MTIGHGTYWNATRCVGQVEETTLTLQSYLLARFPGMRNGGTYGCREIAGSDQLSVHASGRAGDTMTGTGKPTRESLFVREQMRVFSGELCIQGIIHHRQQWWRNGSYEFTNYGGSNPHEDHIHWERTPASFMTVSQIADIFEGSAITGDKLYASKVVVKGMKDTGWGPVSYVQYRLNAHGFGLATDGDAGAYTETAIRTFQTLAGLTVDGVAGPATQGRLQ
jgi:peptidoglycan hydrolase-like protein with peptidoglycan-binding domain